MPATLSPNRATPAASRMDKEAKRIKTQGPETSAAKLRFRLRVGTALLWGRSKPLYQRSLWSARSGAAWIKQRVLKLPKRIKVWGVAVAVSALAYMLFSWIFVNPARLRISCQHYFRSAELSVWIDGDNVYSGTVNGVSRKQFGIFGGGRAPASFSRMVRVPAGRHEIQVRLNAPGQGFDQTRTTYADFSSKKENTLIVSSGRRGLVLVAPNSSNLPPASPDSGYQKYVGSIFLSIMGSGMSAFISFLVQDFMRTQKARLTSSGD